MRRLFYIGLVPIIGFAQPITFVLSFVHFTNEQTTMEESSYPSLDSLAKFLIATDARVEIAGYTDNLGIPADKEKLSLQRAEAICEYLKTKHKIPKVQFMPKGYGPAMPIASNLTPEGRARNNRIEISVLSKIPVATLSFLKDSVFIRKSGLSEWVVAKKNQMLSLFDEILTDSMGRAEISLKDGSGIRVSPNSQILIQELINEPATNFRFCLLNGRLLFKNSKEHKKEKHISMNTKTSLVNTRGADFILESRPYIKDLLSVLNGTVLWQGQIKTSPIIEISAGNGSVCLCGSSPQQPYLLPKPPTIKFPSVNDTLFYNPKVLKPFFFYYSKPGNTQTRLIVSRDLAQCELIYDIMTPEDSCPITPIETDRLYWTLSTIDSVGLEGKSSQVRPLRLIKKTLAPELNIIEQRIEKKADRISIFVKGNTEPMCGMSINAKRVKIPSDGKFSTMIRLKPGTESITLVTTDRAGNSTSLKLYTSRLTRFDARMFVGASYLAGGMLNASTIGYLIGGHFEYKVNPNLSLGLFGNRGQVGCRKTDWEPEGSHYKTVFTIGGVRLGYQHMPAAGIAIYEGLEPGMIIWKSIYDEVVSDWAMNPYLGGILGIKKSITRNITIFAEGGVGYFLNKKPNVGSEDVNSLIPKGALGTSFAF